MALISKKNNAIVKFITAKWFYYIKTIKKNLFQF